MTMYSQVILRNISNSKQNFRAVMAKLSDHKFGTGKGKARSGPRASLEGLHHGHRLHFQPGGRSDQQRVGDPDVRTYPCVGARQEAPWLRLRADEPGHPEPRTFTAD